MPFEGDFKKLGLLQANIARIASIPSRISSEVAGKIAEAIDDQFEKEQDPYGRAWKPLAPSTLRARRRGGILDRTGKLRDGMQIKPLAGSGLKILAGANYGGFHQTGTETMPARPILPYGGFPKEWAKAIEEASVREFQKAGDL